MSSIPVKGSITVSPSILLRDPVRADMVQHILFRINNHMDKFVEKVGARVGTDNYGDPPNDKSKLWDEHDWSYEGQRDRGIYQPSASCYKGTLTRGDFTLVASNNLFFYVDGIQINLENGMKVDIATNTSLHSGIYDYAKFVDGPWWYDFDAWANQLIAATDNEVRRRALIKLERDAYTAGEVERKRLDLEEAYFAAKAKR